MAESPKKPEERKANRRGAARLAAVQALYQMELAQKGINEIFAEFESHWIGREVEGIEFKPSDIEFFRNVITGVVENQRAIDVKIDKALSEGWPLRRVEAVLRAILRAGGYELMYRKDVPARVVITEYVDVTHGFYDEDEPGLVNAVLDAIRGENAGDALRFYPGSPRVVRRLLRPVDRMVLVELNKKDCENLGGLFRGDRQTTVYLMDGYQSLKAFLPPKERRGLIFIDSSFDRAREFDAGTAVYVKGLTAAQLKAALKLP